MQLKGGEQVTLTPGQSFYEGPDDVHLVDRNASTTQPAKFLVVLIKKQRRSGARASNSLTAGYGAARRLADCRTAEPPGLTWRVIASLAASDDGARIQSGDAP